jgi:hypothetical protein
MKAIDKSVGPIPGKFFTFGCHAQSITKAIFEKKSARGDAGSRTRFKFQVSTAPKVRPIARSHVRSRRHRFQGSPAGSLQDSSGMWISQSGNCGNLRVSRRMTRFRLAEGDGRTGQDNKRESFHVQRSRRTSESTRWRDSIHPSPHQV